MRGYVVTSIDVRMLNGYADHPVYFAQEDFRAAIRYLRSMADEWRLDPDRIIAAGNSSGAITAMFMSYDTAGWCKEGESGSAGFDSQPNGVVSISGLFHEPWMNKIGKRAGDPPLLMYHNTGDPYIDFEQAVAIRDHAQSNGLPTKLLIDIDHEGHGNLDHVMSEPYFTELTTFLYQHVTKGAQAPEGC